MADNRNDYFPADVVSDKEKNSLKFGTRVGLAIEQEWFSRIAGGGTLYYDLQQEFHRLRRYSKGEQSIQKYKDEFKTNGDLSYINLDWKPVPIISKFKDIMVNGMDNRLFDVSVRAIDPIASKVRGKEQDRLEREMNVKQFADQLKQATGHTGLSEDPNKIPDNPEELELHMQLNFKQGVEIAEKQAIDYVFASNEYEFIRKRLLEDQVVCGISIAKHGYNTADGITTEYVDPSKMVWSYTEDPAFRDCYYWGELKTVTITQLRKEFPHLSDKEVEEIQDSAAESDNYPDVYYGGTQDRGDKNKVQILYYTYKTYNHSVYKKKYKNSGTESVSEKDDQFNPPADQRSKFDKIQITREVLYEGAKVVKTDITLKWELSKNMVRRDDHSKVVSPYCMFADSMYKGRIESMVQRMTSYADLIQLTHLKLQQAIQRMVPDGVYIDIDSINQVDLGGGINYSPAEALNMYFQTGSVVGRSMAADGDPNKNPLPISPIVGNSSGDKIQILIGSYNHYLNMIRDITGVNEATDGSSPSEYALPGTQKLAAAASSTATRHIQRAVNYVTKKVAEGISERISMALKYSETKEQLIQAIGASDVATLKDISDVQLHDFGVFITLQPDEEERARLQILLEIALKAQEITTADIIDIEKLNDVNYASELLKLRRKKKVEEDHKRAMEQQEAKVQAETQAAQQIAEAEAQKESVIAQSKIQIEEAKHLYGMEKLQAEVAAKKELMHTEFQYKLQITGMQGQAASEKFSTGEDRKDKRQADAAGQNSHLIEQRSTKGPAKDFSATAANPGLGGPSAGGGAGEEFDSAGNDNLSNIGDFGQYGPQ